MCARVRAACAGRADLSIDDVRTEALLVKGGPKDVRPDALLTPCYRGDAEKVQELIKLSADLHATDALGNSPLHLAAFNGHVKVISLLLEAGADATHQNGELDTPLYMAVLSNNLPCVSIIAEKLTEQEFNCANVEGFTPLHYVRCVVSIPGPRAYVAALPTLSLPCCCQPRGAWIVTRGRSASACALATRPAGIAGGRSAGSTSRSGG